MKVRVRFRKLGKVRFTSHRDVARVWERAIRRAARELPDHQRLPRPLRILEVVPLAGQAEAAACAVRELPHEGLGQKSPRACYKPSTRAYPRRMPEMQYPKYFHPHRVCQNGLIYWRALRVYIGYLLSRETIGLEEVGDGLWDVYFGPVRLGGFNERETTGRFDDYLTLKV